MRKYALCLVVVVVSGIAIGSWLLGNSKPAARESGPSWTAAELPDTSAGRQLRDFVEALNSQDEHRLSEFVRQHFTPIGPGGSSIADRERAQQRLMKSTHGMKILDVLSSDEKSISVRARFSLTQEWRQITLFIEETAPHAISGIQIVPIDEPDIDTIQAVSETQFCLSLNEYLNQLTAADQFSGTVVVAQRERTVYSAAFGFADREKGIKNTLETRFTTASLGKVFTAVAIAQLMESDQLRIEDVIGKYIAECPEPMANTVTIQHLLTHQSGIVDFFELPEVHEQLATISDPHRDYLPLFLNQPLRFEPGTKFEYSNSNYILLGAVIERITRQKYAEYVVQNIFEPASMNSTTFTRSDSSDVPIAIPYTALSSDDEKLGTQRRVASEFMSSNSSAAGGCWSTVLDLHRFAVELQDGRLVKSSTLKDLVTPQVQSDRPDFQYGRGFMIRSGKQGRIAGHSGGYPGVDAWLDIYVSTGQIVVILSNYELVAEPVMMYVQRLTAVETN